MKWAHDNDYIIFTNDLDFRAILAVTRATAQFYTTATLLTS